MIHRGQITSEAYNGQPQSNLKKKADKFQLRNILEYKWQVLYKSTMVTKDKERLRNYHILEKTKET